MPDRGLQRTTKILSQIVTHNNIVALQNFPFWSPALIFITLLVGGSVGGSIGGLHSAHRTTFALLWPAPTNRNEQSSAIASRLTFDLLFSLLIQILICFVA